MVSLTSFLRSYVLIVILSVAVTLVLQLNLTRAIFLEGYLKSDRIIAGHGAYLDIIVESSKGNWNIGSPFLKEWRNGPYLYPALNFNIGGLVKRIGGFDAKTTTIVLHYGSLFIMVLAAFTMFLTLFKWHPFGYLVTLAYLFAPGLRGWNELVSPEINFIFFFMFMAFYFSSLSFWKREISLGITAGLLFYTYPYHWTYALPLLLFSDTWEFWKTRHIDVRRALKYVFILGIALLYLQHLFVITKLPYYAETMARIGLIQSHFPAGIGIQLCVAALLSGWFLLRRARSFISKTIGRFDFDKVVIGLLMTFVVLNQQLITGRELEFHSHYFAVIVLFVVAFLGGVSWGLIQWGKAIPHFHVVSSLFITLWAIVAFVGMGRWMFLQTKSNMFHDYGSQWSEDAINVGKWFRGQGIRDAVIYVPPEFSEPITELSENYLVYDSNEKLYLIPNQELISRFTYFDIANAKLTENLITIQNNLFGHLFDAQWQKDNVRRRIFAFLKNEPFEPKPLDEYITFDFSDMYRQRKNVTPAILHNYFLKYNVDYVVSPGGAYDKFLNAMPTHAIFKNSRYKIVHIDS